MKKKAFLLTLLAALALSTFASQPKAQASDECPYYTCSGGGYNGGASGE